MTLRPLTVLTAAAVVTLVAGCTAAPSASPTATAGPLEAYLSAIYAQADDADALNARVESLTAACMTDAGFEYAPPPVTDARSDVEWSPDDPDWVARYGYGLAAGPSAAGGDAGPAADPNAAYVASLTEGEQDAYWATLYGDQAADPTDGGCYGDAFDEVSGPDPTQQNAYGPLMDAIDAFWQSLPDAPELAALDREWSECMAAAGHDFARQPDAQASIGDAIDAVLAADPDAGPDDPAFATLRDDELALAADDLGCREETDYTARARKVQDMLEQQFVDDHRAELDALRAEADELRADR